MDFACEVSANRKAVWLNSWFWAQYDFAGVGIDAQRKHDVMDRFRQASELNRVEISLPSAFRKNE